MTPNCLFPLQLISMRAGSCELPAVNEFMHYLKSLYANLSLTKISASDDCWSLLATLKMFNLAIIQSTQVCREQIQDEYMQHDKEDQCLTTFFISVYKSCMLTAFYVARHLPVHKQASKFNDELLASLVSIPRVSILCCRHQATDPWY